MSIETPDGTPVPQLHDEYERLVGNASGWSRNEFARNAASIPPFLYKFDGGACVEWLRDIIVRSRLFLAPPRTFNDPFDLRGHVIADPDVRKQRLWLRSATKKRFPNLGRAELEARVSAGMARGLVKGWQEAVDTDRETSGVHCFASSGGNSSTPIPWHAPRNVLMWSHYADNHRGLCFQFHTRRDPRTFVAMQRVAYSDDLPIVRLMEDDNRHTDIGDMLYTKAAAWSYEREHRFVMSRMAGNYLRFSPSALTGVLLGCQVKPAFEQTISGLLAERSDKGHPGIRLFRGVRPASSFLLRFTSERRSI